MTWLRRWAKRLRALVRKDAVERELNEELAFHLEMETRYRLESGMSAAEARRSAHVEFGGVERYREQVREARALRVVEDLVADVRYALRAMARRPGFTAAVVLTLGLGIGGTTAIFTVVDGLFLRHPEGVQDGERVRKLYVRRDEGGIQTGDGGPGSFVDYVALRDGAGSFAGVAAYLSRKLDVGRGGEAEQVQGTFITPGYFELLGVRPALGRFFTAEEDRVPGEHKVVVLSHRFWQSRFGGENALGRTLLLNGTVVEVIGVAQKGFTGTEPEPVDVWYPSALAGPLGVMFWGPEEDWRTQPGMAALSFLVRLPEGVSDEAAARSASAALAHSAEEHPMLDPTPDVVFASLAAAAGPTRSRAADLSLWLALVATLVLIIACANVANLLLARAVTRRRELAVRLSLGAGRARIARQQLTESLLLALLGGAAGILVANLGIGLIRQFPLPPSAGRIDARLLGFTIAVSLVTGLLFGVLPALRSVRLDPLVGLREGGAGATFGRSGTRRALVVLQVSLSLALLVGAGLFVRSLRQVYAIDTGMRHDRLLMASVNLRRAGMDAEQREQFYETARQRVAALPFVESAAMVHFSPFSGNAMSVQFRVPGVEEPKFATDEGPYLNLAGPGYFATTGTRVLAGREFTSADASGEPTAIVNEAMARGIAPDGNVVGTCIQLGEQVEEGGCTRIVGVVANTRRWILQEANTPVVFQPRDRSPAAITWGGPALVVRTRGRPEEHTVEVRAALQGLRPDLPYVNVQTVAERTRQYVLPFRLGATLFTMFGVLALVLAGIGLHGVLGYFVAERTAEIGIRRSLGAPVRNVVSLVLRQGLVPVTIGLVIGLAIAYVGARFLASLLFGVEARDPVAFAGAAGFLALVALAATTLPARRAARVDPMVALRHD